MLFKNFLGNKKAMQTEQNAVHIENDLPGLHFRGKRTNAMQEILSEIKSKRYVKIR